MGIINFQKLKQKVKGTGNTGSAGNKKNKDVVNAVEGNIKEASKKSSLKHNIQHKNKVNADKVNAGKVNAGKVNANIPAKISRDSGLLESKYCYGCDQFCVDYPFTDKEQAWCVRPVLNDNGEKTPGYHMVRILPKHKVWQCPKLKRKIMRGEDYVKH